MLGTGSWAVSTVTARVQGCRLGCVGKLLGVLNQALKKQKSLSCGERKGKMILSLLSINIASPCPSRATLGSGG